MYPVFLRRIGRLLLSFTVRKSPISTIACHISLMNSTKYRLSANFLREAPLFIQFSFNSVERPTLGAIEDVCQ